jgi:alkaline phosphatase D
MPASRREFLVGVTAAAAVSGCGEALDTAAEATPTRAPEPDPWAGLYPEDEAVFPGGVQCGDVTDTAALISVRTGAERLTLVVMRADGEVWVEDRVLEGLETDDGGLQLELTGLSSDTAYAYAFHTDDGAGSSVGSVVGRFRTALGEDDWRVVVFAVTSCLGSDDAPWPSMSYAAAERPDFAMLLGDTVYADGAVSVEDYRGYWSRAMATAGLKDFTAATSVIATWDDHEVDNNWTWAETEDVEQRYEAGLKVFTECLPRRPGGGVAGIWRSLRWGPVLEMFMLDCRSERDPEAGIYISREQLDFLKQGLSASTARFKIIATPVPITDYSEMTGDALAEDRWQGYPEQREELLAFLRDEGIQGVLFLAGDFHLGQISAVDPAGGTGEGFVEVLAGPSGSFLNPIAFMTGLSDQWMDLIGDWNAVLCEADPGAGTITVRFIGGAGEVLAERVLAI